MTSREYARFGWLVSRGGLFDIVSAMKTSVLFGFGLIVALSACTDKVAECKATTDRVYKEDLAKCTDDACKKAAEKNKQDYYEACENSGK